MSARQLISFLLSCIGIVITFVMSPGCANIVPPGGGPVDSLPPLLVKSTPADSALNVTASKITLQFDEYIELKNPMEEIILSPFPQNQPSIESKLKNVYIRLKDSLLANTTYSIKFGKSIADLNEGNIQKNVQFIFSTGNHIDSNVLSGRLILAETGKTDSTMWAVLYKMQEDSTVFKENPTYITRVDKNGFFRFEYLPPGIFYLYGLKDADGNKRYNQPIESFAFLDTLITIPADTIAPSLYAFATEKEKKRESSTTKKNNQKTENLEYVLNLQNNLLDLLDTLTISFEDSVAGYNPEAFLLYEDSSTVIKNVDIRMDSGQSKMYFNAVWEPGGKYRLIIRENAASDSSKRTIKQNDTIAFSVKDKSQYGSLRIRFNELDLTKNPVLIFYQNEAIRYSYKLMDSEFFAQLFRPGNYAIGILYDLNGNGVWDPGDYFSKPRKQPEMVLAIDKEVVVKENWDNETEISFANDNP